MGSVPASPLLIEPAAPDWRELVRRVPILTREQRRFREQIGLPPDRPIVMTGHQAQVWHPGILAKYLAADAASRILGASPAWLAVDQDDNDPGAVRYPVRQRDGRLRAMVWRAAPDVTDGAATGLCPSFTPARAAGPAEGEVFAADSVGAGLGRIDAALRAGASQRSAAAQVSAALTELMSPLIRPATTVFATALAATDAFVSLVERIRADPAACILAYNDAVGRHPRAGVRPLAAAGRFELPLWKFDGARRLPVFSDESIAGPLAARGLLMTGLLRSGACDLFIHGTGGAGADAGSGYEAVTDAWFSAWLGAPPPAPVAVVSATLHLPIQVESDPGTPEEAGAAAVLAHRARHDPALVGDHAAAARKRDFVARIDAAKSAGTGPVPLYRRMHEMLEAVRQAHAADIARFDEAAAARSSRLSDARILADRTWPFPLYPDAMLRALKAGIDQAFE